MLMQRRVGRGREEGGQEAQHDFRWSLSYKWYGNFP